MKTNHSQVEMYIRQAIATCSYDSSLSETKAHLQNALIKLESTIQKRERNNKNQKENAAAKTAQQKWWDMLKENAAKNFEIDIKD